MAELNWPNWTGRTGLPLGHDRVPSAAEASEQTPRQPVFTGCSRCYARAFISPRQATILVGLTACDQEDW